MMAISSLHAALMMPFTDFDRPARAAGRIGRGQSPNIAVAQAGGFEYLRLAMPMAADFVEVSKSPRSARRFALMLADANASCRLADRQS